MNADGVLAHYERVVDTLDAIPRLRRFILDLAVRGKLVPQDPNDEPASELLNRIILKKARQMEGKVSRIHRDVTLCDFEEPFRLPRGWQWSKLGNIVTKLTDGTHHSPPNGARGEYKYITAKNIKNEGVVITDVTYVTREVHEEIYSRCDPKKGDILYIKDGATTGVVTLNNLDEPFSMLSSVALLRLSPDLFNQLIVLFLRSPLFYDQMRGLMKGAAITRVTLRRMAPALIPVPPAAEQLRIVNKVDELMALCDRLEGARKEREAGRDRMTAASLARINAPDPDPEIFKTHAHFALNHLAGLTARPEQIKQLRETILSLAVRGQLVPQDCNERPASELLTRIQAERTRQLRSMLNGQRSLQSAEIMAPYSVPNSWLWVRVDDCFNVGGGIQKTPARTPRVNAHPYIGVGNVYRGRLDLSRVKQFELFTGDLDKFRLLRGDLLVVEGNGSENEIGRCAMWSGEIESCVHQNHIIRCRPFIAEVSPFVLKFLNSTHGVQVMKTLAVTSSGLYNLSVGRVRTIIIPLPPLAEQRRIVAKVDELMELCDRLELSLVSAEDHRRRLLGTLLAEALAPVEEIQAV